MKFLPRFSLRLLFIILTIFLIGLGVWVNYSRRYEEHERTAKRLQLINCNVEEEPITFWGYTIGKRLTGIEITPYCGAAGEWTAEDIQKLEVLENLAYPGEMRRFGISGSGLNEAESSRIFAALERYPELDCIYFENLQLTPAQAQRLSRVPKLRTLVFRKCTLPAETLPSLEQLASLEQLTLDGTECDVQKFLQLNLPQLRLFEMQFYPGPLLHLELTRQRWGRFPKLETLILRYVHLQNITLDPGALPRLKILALEGELDLENEISWTNLPAALPELTRLVMPWWCLKPEVLPMVSKFPNLQSVYIDMNIPNSVRTKLTPLAQFTPAQLAKEVPPESLLAIQKLLQKQPDLLFDLDYTVTCEMLNPTGREISPVAEPPGMWPSAHWRGKPEYVWGRPVIKE